MQLVDLSGNDVAQSIRVQVQAVSASATGLRWSSAAGRAGAGRAGVVTASSTAVARTLLHKIEVDDALVAGLDPNRTSMSQSPAPLRTREDRKG